MTGESEEEQEPDLHLGESDLGTAQRHRYHAEEDTGGPELGGGDPNATVENIEDDEAVVTPDESLLAEAEGEALADVDPELVEDLRWAEPNPPLTVERANANSDIDMGFLEDDEEQDLEEEGGPVELDPVDPFEIDREAADRPGASSGPHPGELMSDPDEEG